MTSKQIVDAVVQSFVKYRLRSGCLAAAMFCKLLLEKYTDLKPVLIKGYAVVDDLYWGHFWLECGDKIIDPGTMIWLLDHSAEMREELASKRVIVKDHPANRLCIDSPGFDAIQACSFAACIRGEFWQNVEEVAGKNHVMRFKKLFSDIEKSIIH